ncbi:MAG: glycosyltransferase, partial [Candidatus Gracilibacteria bacterium]|nr:glycosyltransferase [Candidatus Gracilibacteria bacterium]
DWISQDDLPHILDGADIAITRASATTLAELTTRPIHLIIIPLAISAGNHQVYNARMYEREKHTVIYEQYLEQIHIGKLLDVPNLIEKHTTKNQIAPLLKIFQK